MQGPKQYTPLNWPPDMSMAQTHYDCCKPGIDNPQGYRCPCCQRLQKLQNSKWPTRDIVKDFKNYGGGVPGYFYILIYFIIFFGILTVVKVLYHIYVLQKVCPSLQTTKTPCTKALGVFKFCSTDILFQSLDKDGKDIDAIILQMLQLATYVILVIATVCIKIFLQYLNKDKISLHQKLFSRFSLIIKGVPLYYQLDDLKQEIKTITNSSQVCEVLFLAIQIFYLHKVCEYQNNFRILFDLYYQISWLQQNLKTDDRDKKLQQLRIKYQQYIEVYDVVDGLADNLKKNTKKVLIVFNTIEEKELVHKHLKLNQCKKFAHYISKIIGMKSDPIGYYSERVSQPQEIHWKYVGESSTYKQKVRIETTIIGVGFMVLSFVIFYFPMLKIDQEKVYAPGVGTALGFLVSILIIILAIVYRQIILKLMPTRKPSSKLAQSYFIVMTTIVFHFFFYLVSPAFFYIFADSIPQNIKLKQFFMAIVGFSLMSILVAFLDLRYRLFNKKRQRLLGQVSQANVFCQQRLHEQLTPPSFPIEFKLMVAFNIWTFNSFYIFQLPYLLFFFMIVLLILYWVDKYNLYKHYKMQHYLSIELQLKVQKTYIILFLICVSLGYYLSTHYFWQKYVIIGVVVVALIINFSLNYTYKKQKDHILKTNTDLKSALQKCKTMQAASLHLNMIEQQMKSSFIVPINPQIQFSSVSLASQILLYGYNQTYNLYLKQFKNKQINNMLEQKYFVIKHSKTVLDGRKRKQSQMAYLEQHDALQEKLISEEKLGNFEEKMIVEREEKMENEQGQYLPPQEQPKEIVVPDAGDVIVGEKQQQKSE